MSGAAAASSGCKTAAPAVPLSCSVSLTDLSSTFNVAGASGDLYASNGTVITSTDVGGTGSYTDTVHVVNDGGTGGSASLILSGDSVHNTVAWSGLAVGQTVLFHITLSVNDGVNTATDRYPGGGSIGIKRVS